MMKTFAKIAAVALLLLPLIASATTAVPWSITNLTDGFIFPNLVNGTAKGVLISASSTVNSNLTVSTLSSGNCVQASTGGLLTTIAGPCGSSSGLTSYDAFTHPSAGQSATTSVFILTTGGLVINAASSTIQGNLVINGNSTTTNATSTSLSAINALFTNASTTNLIVSSAGGTAGCATFSTNGTISNTGIACGSGSSTFGTSSLSALWPIIYTQSASLAQFSFGGLSTSSPLTQGQALYATGVNTIASTPTTSVTCGSGASCSSFTVFGSSPVTITASGSAGSFDPFTHGFFNGQAVSATSTGLYLTGSPLSLIASSSLTTNATTTSATSTSFYTTNLGINSEYFTDLTGTGLSNVGGALTNTGLLSYDPFTHPASGQSATTSTLILTTGGLVINAASSSIFGNLNITGNATTTNATTTALAVSNLTSGNCVQVGAGGNLINSPNGSCGAATGLSAYNAFTNPTLTSFATTSGMVINNASSTFVGSVTITGGSTTTNATTTTLAITGAAASNCNGTNALTTSSTGIVQCTAQPQGTVTSVSGTAQQITSSGGATPVLSLPSYVLFPNGYSAAIGSTTNATSTNLTVTTLASTTALIVSNAGGTAGCATFAANGLISNTGTACGTGGGSSFGNTFTFVQGTPNYLIPTTSPTGIISTASSTLGNGNQTGGLTVNGGATTTGFLAVQGLGTSTFVGGINLTGTDCFATQGTCLQTFIQNATAYKQAVSYATAAVLSGTPTYSNGTAGVGATLTEVGTGALTVDGQNPSAGQRVLIKNQADQTTNGIYTVTVAGSGIASYVLTRSTDYNTSNDIYAGTTVPVLVGGTANGDTQWTESTTGTIVVGTSNIVFIETSFGTSGTVTSVGTGLGLSGGPITTTGTITIASSSIFTGTTGQNAYFSGTNVLTGTSSIFTDVAGKIGIGTLTPTDVNANAHLTVAGIGSQDIIASTTDNTTLSDAIVQAYADASRVFMGAHGSAQVTSRYGITLGGWGEIGAFNSTAGNTNGLIIGTNPAVPLVFGTNNFERERILSTGQVGIGTTSPYALFSIMATSTAQGSPKTLFAIGSSTSAFATSTLFSVSNTGVASTTGLIISNAGGTGTRCLQVGADGTVSANASACGTGGGGSFDPFTHTTYNGQTVSATSTGLFLTGSPFGLIASSTFVTNATTTNATTTSLAIIGQAANCNSTNALTTTAAGQVTCTAQPQGTVTSIATGLGLSGGTITNTGTITLASSSIFTGTTGQNAYFNGTNSLIGTSSLFIATNQFVGIGTTTPQFPLTISNATKPQLTLTDGTLTSSPWNFRAIGTSFLLSTSSPTTFATSSNSVLTIDGTQPASLSIGSTTQTLTSVNGLFTQGTNGANGSSTVSGGKMQWDMYNAAGTRSCMFVVGTSIVVQAGACNP